MHNFALIGAAGYIAPRHMRAIKETGHALIAALDPNDSVGILDSYFPDAQFFTEFERFDRHVDLLRRRGTKLDYVAIASPNYLHDSHIRFALRVGANAVCEKPLVVNPWNAEALKDIEAESGRRIYNILQLRLHPAILELRDRIARAVAEDPTARFEIDLTYVTGRGSWYFTSWKGDDKKSGGIAANIGVHFYDMLIWLFGPPTGQRVDVLNARSGSGVVSFRNARARWFLSVDAGHLPDEVRARGQRTYRSISLNGAEIDFSEGFTDLHTASYRHIMESGGFGVEDALPSIQLVYEIRTAAAAGLASDSHPLAHRALDEAGA